MTDEERRAAAEARLADVDARREARRKDAELLDLERAADDAEKLAELEAEHGDGGVACIRGKARAADCAVFLKTPHPNTFNKFAEYGDKITAQRVKEFVWPCILAPQKADVEAAIAREPALLYALGSAVAALGGAAREAERGKF